MEECKEFVNNAANVQTNISLIQAPIYVFKTSKCKTVIEESIGLEFDNSKSQMLILIPEDGEIKFAFSNSSGNIHRDDNYKNVLTDFISFDYDDINKAKKQIEQFIKNNGYPFKNPAPDLSVVAIYEINKISYRMKVTFELLNALGEKVPDYEKILSLLISLIFLNPVSINSGGVKYRSYMCELTKLIFNDESSDFDDSDNNEAVDSTLDHYWQMYSDMMSPGIIKFIREPPLEQRLSDLSLHSSNTNNNINKTKENSSFIFNKIIMLYENRQADIKATVTQDLLYFLYIYYFDIGVPKKLSIDGIEYYQKPDYEKFDNQMKNELIRLAKCVVSEEINYNLREITPAFDPKTLRFSWKIDSLIEALYFAMSTLRPNVKLYRRCKKCDSYFTVNSTNSKREYCRKECQNNRNTKGKK